MADLIENSKTNNESSAFSLIRNARDLEEVMSYLEGENIAAIVEAIRQEKWASKLIPLFLGHPNHIIRYEIACSDTVTDKDLSLLRNDKELIVRQAASKNIKVRNLMKEGKAKQLEFAKKEAALKGEKKKEEDVAKTKNLKEIKKSDKKKKNKKGEKK